MIFPPGKLAMLLAAVALLCTVAAQKAKVEICHFPPGDPENFHTISVSENAVDAHLARGAILGSCDMNCDSVCSDGDPCTIDYDAQVGCETLGCYPVPRPQVDCNDGVDCTVDTCSSLDGGCLNTPDDANCPLGTCDPLSGCIVPTPPPTIIVATPPPTQTPACGCEANPCTQENIDAGLYYFPGCTTGFAQCAGVGSCFDLTCPPGTAWNQALLGCV